jgi:hypothetical protein
MQPYNFRSTTLWEKKDRRKITKDYSYTARRWREVDTSRRKIGFKFNRKAEPVKLITVVVGYTTDTDIFSTNKKYKSFEINKKLGLKTRNGCQISQLHPRF